MHFYAPFVMIMLNYALMLVDTKYDRYYAGIMYASLIQSTYCIHQSCTMIEE